MQGIEQQEEEGRKSGHQHVACSTLSDKTVLGVPRRRVAHNRMGSWVWR